MEKTKELDAEIIARLFKKVEYLEAHKANDQHTIKILKRRIKYESFWIKFESFIDKIRKGLKC